MFCNRRYEDTGQLQNCQENSNFFENFLAKIIEIVKAYYNLFNKKAIL
jgi:hypothetical protein